MKKMSTIVFLFSLLFFLGSQGLMHSQDDTTVVTHCQENSEVGTCNGNSCCMETGSFTCICSLDKKTWEHSCGNYGDIVECNPQ